MDTPRNQSANLQHPGMGWRHDRKQEKGRNLNKMLLKEFEEATSIAIMVQCPKQITKCTLNLRNEQEAVPTTICLNPLRYVKDPTQLIETLKFDTHIQSPANGLSGGIVIMWKEDIVKIESLTIP
ncbi:hypothetical protein KY290_007943 [Solanum tuberosum]|uniref:Uncharacterized protein n=1 Tax=Solanum tuberosum TaxID=4113 RepID=A0ABQ7W732_SOLTU|nr:hypothetical protein KY290_007943 [Solanum tuberosum]